MARPPPQDFAKMPPALHPTGKIKEKTLKNYRAIGIRTLDLKVSNTCYNS